MDILISNLNRNLFWTSGSGQTENTQIRIFVYCQLMCYGWMNESVCGLMDE